MRSLICGLPLVVSILFPLHQGMARASNVNQVSNGDGATNVQADTVIITNNRGLSINQSNSTPEACGNGILYYRMAHEINIYRQQIILSCKGYRKHLPTPLSIADILTLDQNISSVKLDMVGTDVHWGKDAPLSFDDIVVSGRIKNYGKTSINIESNKIGLGVLRNMRPKEIGFPSSYTLRPGEEIIVPLAHLSDMLKMAKIPYRDSVFYTASIGASKACSELSEIARSKGHNSSSCNEISHGFAISTEYYDIFGNKFFYNDIINLNETAFESRRIDIPVINLQPADEQ